MRKLIATRGLPASGKSSFVSDIGLAHHAVSLDVIRMVLASPNMDSEGRLTVRQDFNDRASAIFREVMNGRAARGDTIVVDATNYSISDVRSLEKFAREWRYETLWLDFSGVPIEECVRRDSERVDWKRAGERAIRRMSAALYDHPIPDDVRSVDAAGDATRASEIVADFLRPTVHEFDDRYSRIVHIGDLQGCLTVLAGEGGPLENGFEDGVRYVFVGDLLDRGIENGRVLRWWLDHAQDNEHVDLLWGNHEDHLARWADGEEALSNEFGNRTLPQLVEAGITREEAARVVARARPYLNYRFAGAKVLVTHAGLPAAPARLELLEMRSCTHGIGHYSDPVDVSFAEKSPDWIQVHGHRNLQRLPVEASANSFNLEDGVEHGGNLRLATLHADGSWTTEQHRNRIFKPLRTRVAEETMTSEHRRNERAFWPGWAFGEWADTRISEEILSAMDAHPGVRRKANESFPHVASLNFTRQVFFDRSWDDVSIKARGFFFDTGSREIVSRGYDKSYDVGERPETSLEAICAEMEFPVRAFVKENGFLGNLGIDPRSGDLFVASKSTPDGPFAGMFDRILRSKVTPENLDGLRRYLTDHDACMTFEVIDPELDPHIVRYDDKDIVLLDILRRNSEYGTARYEVVEKVCKRFGLRSKETAGSFKDAMALRHWYNRVAGDPNVLHKGREIEGVMLVDRRGRMVKVKFGSYRFWKAMRGMRNRIQSNRKGGRPIGEHKLVLSERFAASERRVAKAFTAFLHGLTDEQLDASIPDLRDDFGKVSWTAEGARYDRADATNAARRALP